MQNRNVRLIFAKRRSHDISTAAATHAIAARHKTGHEKTRRSGFSHCVPVLLCVLLRTASHRRFTDLGVDLWQRGEINVTAGHTQAGNVSVDMLKANLRLEIQNGYIDVRL